jgi:arabinose-5-phosphate isomerase
MAAVKKPAPAADDIEVGRRVLMDEAEGLKALADVLDDSFVRALDAMQRTRGRVIVSGMGKSGHVARKIAATLASTGTPAQYVNPGEASHGDLGMITRDDAVLALSNSGETAELSDLVAHTKLLNIPLIAMVGRRGSGLDAAADASLVLPDLAEACSLNLAPTTSTTAMLALGDALAVALLERQGFSPEDFSALHPGGQLGRRFIRLSQVMHAGGAMPLAAPETPMSEALLTMTEKSFGCIGITGPDGALIGIVTDGDLRRHMDGTLLERTAGEVMTPDPLTMPPDMLAAAALRTMNERKITAVFVVQDGAPRGIVKIHDLVRAGIV